MDLDWSSFFCYQPYPGTEIYQLCVGRGYIKEEDDNIKSNIYLLNAISTENFSANELIFKNYCANIDLNFLNNRNFNGRGRFEQAYRDFIDMVLVYPTHVFAHYCLSEYFRYKNDESKSRYYFIKAKECAEKDRFYEPYIKHFNFEEKLLNYEQYI